MSSLQWQVYAHFSIPHTKQKLQVSWNLPSQDPKDFLVRKYSLTGRVLSQTSSRFLMLDPWYLLWLLMLIHFRVLRISNFFVGFLVFSIRKTLFLEGYLECLHSVCLRERSGIQWVDSLHRKGYILPSTAICNLSFSLPLSVASYPMKFWSILDRLDRNLDFISSDEF